MSTTDVAEVNDKRVRREREHLHRLLDRRDQLATRAAERRSHGLPEALDDLNLMYLVEEVIEQKWPDAFNERLASWAEQDDALLHSPTRVDPRCGICQRKTGHRPPMIGHSDVA